MSAFSAFHLESSLGSVFGNDSLAQVDDNDGQLGYANSSDEESVTPKPAMPFVSDAYRSVLHDLPPVYKSNITLSDKNCSVDVQSQSLKITLFEREHILINGQFNLKVLKGSCLLNGHYHLLSDANKVYQVLATQSQALPVLSHEHTNTDSSETTVLISSLYTGLENIGLYHPPLKNIFYRGSDASYPKDSLMNYLNNPSFEIVSADKGLVGLQIHHTWSRGIQSIENRLASQKSPIIIMAVGNKNTGKSTFTKTLLNTILLRDSSRSISYMDLDPGQSEFSPPYCLSLSSEKSPIFGLSCPNEDSVSHYYGFTSAASDPHRYVEIVTSLFEAYREKHMPLGNSLIINTPGWVKGFGKEILIEISALLNPHDLVVLSNSNDPMNADNQDLLRDLLYEHVHYFSGSYQTSKFSHSQLREYNKIAYFHRAASEWYDFENHLLDGSPLKIPYKTRNSNADFRGIDSITFLNYVQDKTFDSGDVFSMLEATIAGVYLVPISELGKRKQARPKSDDLPYCMNPDEFILINPGHTAFAGLIMVHSVNRDKRLINVYMPFNVKKLLQSYDAEKYKLMLVKGDGDIPTCEILHPAFLAALKSQHSKEAHSDNTVSYPYISTKTQTGLGGVWKVRRNVLRRGHARK